MHLDIATLTDKGRQRDVNEDSLYAQVLNVSETEPIGLLVVCDGMGGHLGGECASHWAIETLKKELGDLFCSRDSRATLKLSEAELEAVISGHQVTRKLDISGIGTEITEAVEKANQVVMEYARQKPSEAGDAGTTLTMAVVKNGAAMIANVGDSRTFILRDGILRQITNDHSLVWGLYMKQQISEEEIYTHPSRSVIYRSLGQKER
jgi:serine/threonine protein phosphatase PrpC